MNEVMSSKLRPACAQSLAAKYKAKLVKSLSCTNCEVKPVLFMQVERVHMLKGFKKRARDTVNI
jgi:hypothetical protein